MLPPSACPEGQLTLSRWPGSFCPPPPSPPLLLRMHCKDCQPIHTHCLKVHSRSFHPSHTLSNCCIGEACVTHECLTIFGPDMALASVRPCICSAVHRVLDFNLPPSQPLCHSPLLYCAQRTKIATENHFVFMVQSPESSLVRAQHGHCLKIAWTVCTTTMNQSIPP